jgi:molybdate transport system permease protein
VNFLLIEWQPLILTFKLAAVTSFILLLIGVPIAYFLAYTKTRSKPILEALVSMPLVLPPSVLGFYLLLVFSPQSGLGLWIHETFNVQFVFSFIGIVLGSIIFSLPFMVQPIQAGFQQLPMSLIEASQTLGLSKWQTFLRVLIPNIKPSLLTGVVLSFAHTIGEFGVILMIGGNIPGVTKVASIAIYDEVESLNYYAAHFYSLVLVLVSFLVLLIVYVGRGKLTNIFYERK